MTKAIIPIALTLLVVSGCERFEVTVIRVARGPVESTITSVEAGIVEPRSKANLASPVSGRIVKVNCEEGDRVRASDVLIELENHLEKLLVDETARDFTRLKKMKDEVATEEQIEDADFAHRRALEKYDRTLIRAPFAGLVAEINARVGEMTFGSMALALGGGGAGGAPLIYLVDDSKLFVEAEIDESDVFRVQPGQPVKVTLGGVGQRTLRARVVSLSPVVSTDEGESRTAEVKVELLAPGYQASSSGDGGSTSFFLEASTLVDPSEVLVGMSADLEILVKRTDDALRIPTTSILDRGAEKFVFVVLGGKLVEVGKLERRKIVTGIGNWDLMAVISGLAPGDLVVLPTDVKLLADGLEVKVVVDDARLEGR
jgi:HlyD family secretion protein